MQIARTRALNKEACYRCRATHLAKVRYINRVYYHRNRDRIVQQQRERRALAKQNKQNKQNPSPFRKLRALADVCSARWIELDHGYARKEEKAEPPQNRASQGRYRERKNAAVDGIEQVRARNRQRYYDRIDRLKATGQYEAYKKKKCQEGLRRYHTMPEEQKAWRDKMIREGNYKEYQRRLNARRREQLAEKKRATGIEGGRRCSPSNMPNGSNPNTVDDGNGWTSNWPVPFPCRGCRWTGRSPSLRRTLCKPFVSMHCSKWTSTCK